MDIISFEQMPGIVWEMAKEIKYLKTQVDRLVEKPASNQIKLLSRQEVANQFHITLPTLHAWTLEGKIRAHRIGRRVLYKQQEIENALSEIKVK